MVLGVEGEQHHVVVEVQGLVDEQLDVYVVHGLLQGGDYLQDVVVEDICK